MPRFVFPLFLLLFVAIHSLAQHKANSKMVRALQADIGYLASDELEGRRTGTEGERKAGDYIIGRYQKLRIPAYQYSYRHPYKFIRGRELGKSFIKLGNLAANPASEVFPFAYSANSDVSADVLVDVQEHGALWTIPLYASEEEANNPHFDAEKSAWERAREAARTGAAGVIFYDSYGSKYAPAFNPISDYETISIPVIYIGNKEWKRITDGEANAINVQLHIDLVKPERSSSNIAAFIDNKQPLTVVIGAHYDHLGHGEDGGSLYVGKEPMIHNGADDNASGTAALIQLATWVKKSKLKHYNYLFVHFSGEELGLLGSKAFVKTIGIDSNHIGYMMNMDMVGRLVDSSGSLTIGGLGTSPGWGKVKSIIEQDGFTVKADSSGIGPSDHTSFYENGIPVLFFFTGIHSDYHKPSDDADKINYAGEVRIIEGIEHVLKSLDIAPRPQFAKTKTSSMGRVRFKVTLGIMPDYSWNGDGLRVDGVIDGKPAQAAGIHAGDVIIRLGADEVKGMQTYMEALSHQKEGANSKVTVLRDGKKMELPIQFQ